MLGHVGLMLGVVSVGQNAAVHLRVQGHDPMPEHDRRAGVVGHIGHVDSRVGDDSGGATTRDEFPAQIGQALGEFDDSGLVVDGQQGMAGFSHGSNLPGAFREEGAQLLRMRAWIQHRFPPGHRLNKWPSVSSRLSFARSSPTSPTVPIG